MLEVYISDATITDPLLKALVVKYAEKSILLH